MPPGGRREFAGLEVVLGVPRCRRAGAAPGAVEAPVAGAMTLVRLGAAAPLLAEHAGSVTCRAGSRREVRACPARRGQHRRGPAGFRCGRCCSYAASKMPAMLLPVVATVAGAVSFASPCRLPPVPGSLSSTSARPVRWAADLSDAGGDSAAPAQRRQWRRQARSNGFRPCRYNRPPVRRHRAADHGAGRSSGRIVARHLGALTDMALSDLVRKALGIDAGAPR